MALFAVVTQAAPLPAPSPALVTLKGSERRLQYSVPLAEQAALQIETDKRQYGVGEPVRARLTISNIADADIHCYCTLHSHTLEIQYRRPPDQFRTMELSRKPQVGHIGSLFRLRPGEGVSTAPQGGGTFPAMGANLLLAFDFRKGSPPFDHPGAYEIRVVYFDKGRVAASRLVSRPVLVDVVLPEQRDAHQAYSHDLARFVQGDGPASAALIGDAAEFIHRFRTSVYERFVRVRLRPHIHARLFGEGGAPRESATDADRRLYESLSDEGDLSVWP